MKFGKIVAAGALLVAACNAADVPAASSQGLVHGASASSGVVGLPAFESSSVPGARFQRVLLGKKLKQDAKIFFQKDGGAVHIEGGCQHATTKKGAEKKSFNKLDADAKLCGNCVKQREDVRTEFVKWAAERDSGKKVTPTPTPAGSTPSTPATSPAPTDTPASPAPTSPGSSPTPGAPTPVEEQEPEPTVVAPKPVDLDTPLLFGLKTGRLHLNQNTCSKGNDIAKDQRELMSYRQYLSDDEDKRQICGNCQKGANKGVVEALAAAYALATAPSPDTPATPVSGGQVPPPAAPPAPGAVDPAVLAAALVDAAAQRVHSAPSTPTAPRVQLPAGPATAPSTPHVPQPPPAYQPQPQQPQQPQQPSAAAPPASGSPQGAVAPPPSSPGQGAAAPSTGSPQAGAPDATTTQPDATGAPTQPDADANANNNDANANNNDANTNNDDADANTKNSPAPAVAGSFSSALVAAFAAFGLRFLQH